MTEPFELITRAPNSAFAYDYPGFGYRTERRDGMIIEKDVAVPMRDGVTIYVDIFRPDSEVLTPALVAWSPYGKHFGGGIAKFPGRGGVPADAVSNDAKWEGPDPRFWCPNGYTVVNPDSRGVWHSDGYARRLNRADGEDYHDLVEWIAAQPWNSGRVGAAGVSYLAISQWFMAATRPPHLAAINPWEGYNDVYRDLAFHGGIRDTGFPPLWNNGDGSHSLRDIEDLDAMMDAHPLFDEYWESKRAQLELIDVPAYVVASWSDQAHHTRGTMEGFRRIGSDLKWLEVHGRRKWEYFYRPESLANQLAFFDHFLLDKDTGWLERPRVIVEVRDALYSGRTRSARSWPLEETHYERLYLASGGALQTSPPTDTGVVAYDSASDQSVFDYRFETDTDVVGYMAAQLWVQTPEADDMDLFLSVEKLDMQGERVPFPYFSAWLDGPIALGWLRASHRALDESSTPFQPVHPHTSEEPLLRDRFTRVDVEIWASGTGFKAGEGLRLIVAGKDIHAHMSVHENTRNIGEHRLQIGGADASSLLIPTVPRRENDSVSLAPAWETIPPLGEE